MKREETAARSRKALEYAEMKMGKALGVDPIWLMGFSVPEMCQQNLPKTADKKIAESLDFIRHSALLHL